MREQREKPKKRIFKYLTHIIKDPSPKLTIEQIKQALIRTFPALANSTHTTKTLKDGTVEVTFHKQSTTKGVIAQIAKELNELKAIQLPTDILAWHGGDELNIATILQNQSLLNALFNLDLDLLQDTEEAVQQCLNLKPIPAPYVPLGF